MKQNKRPSKLHHIAVFNEIGEPVDFEMPRAAIYYGTGSVSIAQEERTDKAHAYLIEQALKRFDHTEVLIHDLDDKVKVVNRLRRKGVWV